jgi:hypothetical protein
LKTIENLGKRTTYDHCCCHKQQAPPVRRICKAHTRYPRRRRRSDSVVEKDSFGFWDRTPDSDRGWASGSSDCRKA